MMTCFGEPCGVSIEILCPDLESVSEALLTMALAACSASSTSAGRPSQWRKSTTLITTNSVPEGQGRDATVSTRWDVLDESTATRIFISSALQRLEVVTMGAQVY